VTVTQISREFDSGYTEPWRGGLLAASWSAYVREMLLGKKASQGIATSVRLRMDGGQMVVIKPKVIRP